MANQTGLPSGEFESLADTLGMQHRVLLVEDATDIQRIVSQSLQHNCVLTLAGSVREARTKLESESFDLVLLDLGLPDGDGFKLCAFIRQSESLRDLPVFFLTGRKDIEDKEMAFSIGADDYIQKPFDARELKARVYSRLERSKRKAPEMLCVGDLKLSAPTMQVSVGTGSVSTALSLTPLEFKILYYLAGREGQVFSREQIIKNVWGQNVHITDRTVDSHVSHLRKKLEAATSSCALSPVQGIGYLFSTKKAA